MSFARRALPAITLAAPALAQQGRPTRLIVPFPAGGGLDTLARAIAERLGATWGQPVLVDNRPGGATVPGTDAVCKAPPDGHTLLMTADNSITANPLIIRGLPHDPMRDLAPVSFLVEVHQMVLATSRLATPDLATLIQAARSGTITYGSYGQGSQPHVLFSALAVDSGADFTEIPYRGLPPAILGLLAGEVMLTLSGIASAREHIAAGTMRALAVGRSARFPALPNVPTLAEAGHPAIDPRTWFGVFAPAATPAPVQARISADIAAVMADAALAARHLTPNGYTVHAATPEVSRALVAEDFACKRQLLRRAGLALA